jgi:hypothetical protein
MPSRWQDSLSVNCFAQRRAIAAMVEASNQVRADGLGAVNQITFGRGRDGLALRKSYLDGRRIFTRRHEIPLPLAHAGERP